MELTPLEFSLALKDNERFEISKIQPLCESIRISAWYILNTKLKRRIRNPKKLFSFPWDVEVNKQPQTIEQMKNVMRAIATDTKNKKKRGHKK